MNLMLSHFQKAKLSRIHNLLVTLTSLGIRIFTQVPIRTLVGQLF